METFQALSMPARAVLDMSGVSAVERLAVGDGFLAWSAKSALRGLVLWGSLTDGAAAALVRAFDRGIETARGSKNPCDFVLDARRLTSCEPAAYDLLAEALAGRVGEVRRRVRRQALVRGPGVLGAAVTGFYAAIDVELAARSFGELTAALRWLERGDALAASLEALAVEAESGSVVVGRLRAWLREHGDRRCAIDEPARALGLSPRTLQRELQRAATSFRGEVEHARLAIAQHFLQTTDHKIAAIAARVGMSSDANFSAFFRRLTRLSPTEWRRQHRLHHR